MDHSKRACCRYSVHWGGGGGGGNGGARFGREDHRSSTDSITHFTKKD